ncbi:MAG: cysteine desulfurase [Acidobacteria bacterium]|nr:cysteine desulfurase [Acidobacteriota bacterium]
MAYFDHHATTPCDPDAVEKMLPFFTEGYGNPSAITHVQGRAAAMAVREARERIASFFGVAADCVIFTAGATESNNLVIRSLVSEGAHVVTSAVEHKSVLEPIRTLERSGAAVTVIDVDSQGFVDPARIESAIEARTKLVTIGWANGEIGTIQPVEQIARLCREKNVPFHTDATQAVGKIETDLSVVPCDYLSMSAHKCYGPKGVGALVARKPMRLTAMMEGGGQERKLRSGTLNVPGIVGMAAALDLRKQRMTSEAEKLRELRDALVDCLDSIGGVSINGPADEDHRLPGNLSFTLERVDAEAFIMAMEKFALSTGSACSSGDRQPSHVLRAIGLDDRAALSTIRVGLGRGNTMDEVAAFCADAARLIPKLREMEL